MYNIEEVYEHYAICLLWAETDGSDAPLEDNYDIVDISPESKQEAIRRIQAFIEANAATLGGNFVSAEMLGHNLWLTPAGHGAGFFGRGYDDDDKLTESAKAIMGGLPYAYVGDDDKIHIAFPKN